MSRIQISSIALNENQNPQTSFARELRRADGFTSLAVTVAEQALAGLNPHDDRGETGIFIGTAFGPLATNFAALDTLLDDGEGQMSPTLFSHSVFNTAAGYISRLFKLRGPAYTLTNYCWPFFLALREGKTAVEHGIIRRAVVLEVEIYSRILTEAGQRSKGEDFPVLVPGAVAWILEDETDTGNEPVGLLDSLEFEEYDVAPEEFLSPRPLEHSFAVSRTARQLKKLPGQKESWCAEELFGKARVDLQSP
ncbi:MAG: beta-ketoacyl synthase N-terminal-like domain-containing protein [Desulfurivibrionaceae bacterium]